MIGWEVAGVPVHIKRSARRRTVAVQVTPDAVTLFAPTRVPLAQLRDILDARRDWVAGHLAGYAARPPQRPEAQSGQRVPFLGQNLTLHLDAARTRPERTGDTLHLPAQDAEAHLTAWTRRACAAPYRELVQEYAARLSAADRLSAVHVSDTRTRWGSCSADGVIRLHWKLSRAPTEILHYVALHEAAHLLELNHSPRYWAHVTRLMPDWQTHRAWLKEDGHTL
ncbi:M48 family metallopeptidase [Deinococcus sp. JMULE3]|uniref:M48 family metallopeptidase n=1 Tax=Deinococcus sp. JMULE3 TaxID=2518341 RepID=UPI001576CD52|nr:SprT family zinc-dependent metalloprotease [Deinococcus sp. JMULE3]NTY00235.1 M48 family peptidase [Deinococcus sp. JMULE3]